MKEVDNSTVKKEEEIVGNGETISSMESSAKEKLKGWLNRLFRIKMTDGRVLTGAFLCTDRDGNVILGSCTEYLSEEHKMTEARTLGLVMVPGRHIVTIQLDA
ncbi:N-alpha-acetyltransferase 38, NatC auxiliary subunit [Leptopilina boulardi]|uniref:N-alpha-acetyltransferase 38, NatC auxiliary subunit n=1 Tax=Leptopilina boulardi TaxID=63433 RepID=UPI0021F60F92|nr:N-alpha-acetyltransferase 38, NatC auxiliary subunit [Leptopilina boulardi]